MTKILEGSGRLSIHGASDLQTSNALHLGTSDFQGRHAPSHIAPHLLDFGRAKVRRKCSPQLGLHSSFERHNISIRRNLCVKCDKGSDVLVADSDQGDPLDRLVLHASGAVHHSESALPFNHLGREIMGLALPAMVAQAIEPMAQLMETAFVGRLGSIELAAVGVSVSIFNLVSKVFNVPLLSTTTSFVAEDDAMQEDSGTINKENNFISSMGARQFFLGKSKSKKRVVPAVSSSLFLASVLALVEATVLFFGVRSILTLMGVPPGSPMRSPATKYLAVRALGAPANVLALAIQGMFRGFKDTTTPLYAITVSNICNIALSALLIFGFKFGVIGAAVATVSSQYFLAFLLLWKLSQEVQLIPPNFTSLHLDRFLKSGGFLLGRTMAVLFTMTFATSMAARQGVIPMAGHQILMQIWLAMSLLTDALGLAGQALIASAYAKGDLKRVKDIAFTVMKMSLVVGVSLTAILSIGLGPMSRLFSKDPSVLQVLSKGVLFVAGTQPLTAIAFVVDGIYFGVSDFKYAAYSMMTVGTLSSLCLLIAPSFMGLPGVWLGLSILMALRVAAGWFRFTSGTGPWQFLRQPLSF